MLQEDSNDFEIVEKKSDELSTSTQLTGTSMSSERIESLSSSSTTSSASLLLPSPVAGTNLLSSVPPPSELPSFIALPKTEPAPSVPTTIVQQEQFYPTTFSPAIPASKGVLPPDGKSNDVNTSAAPLPSAAGGGSLFGWMKDAVSSGGGVLSKVAEKAKHSVDSMITTLDPQMREFIYSGGDLDLLVASEKEIKISPIREAFQSVFGKATVVGVSMEHHESTCAPQPVGFDSGLKAAEERIAAVYAKPHHNTQPLPIVVAVENFLVEITQDKWYDLGLLILNDPSRQIHLETFTQMTPVPSAIVQLAQEDTPEDYKLRSTGFAVPIGTFMANNLQVDHSQWHQALTGVSRRELILLAARTLATLYKNALRN